MAFEFKRKNSLEKRKQLSARILESYPGRVPVIVERAPNSRLPNIQKTKFLSPDDIPMAKFVVELRKHLPIRQDQGLFLFLGDNVLPRASAIMAEVYQRFKDNDGFLYITYSGETVFGE